MILTDENGDKWQVIDNALTKGCLDLGTQLVKRVPEKSQLQKWMEDKYELKGNHVLIKMGFMKAIEVLHEAYESQKISWIATGSGVKSYLKEYAGIKE